MIPAKAKLDDEILGLHCPRCGKEKLKLMGRSREVKDRELIIECVGCFQVYHANRKGEGIEYKKPTRRDDDD